MTGYAELQVTTNYSFLRGASHPEELFAQAKLLGLPALGITDRNSLAGIVALPSARRGSRRAHAGGLPPRSDRRHVVLVYPPSRPVMRGCAGSSASARAVPARVAAIWPGRMWPRMPTSCCAMLLPDQPDDALRSSLAADAVRFRRSCLSGADLAPPARGCGAAASAGRTAARRARSDGRDRRCALSRAATPRSCRMW